MRWSVTWNYEGGVETLVRTVFIRNWNTTKENPSSERPRHKGGKRQDLGGVYFRSSWEANVARVYDHLGIKWQHEPRIFYFAGVKRGQTSYTPDFYLPETNQWVEVKGYMDQASQVKIKRFAKYYPAEASRLIIIDREAYRDLERHYRLLIAEWEE